MDLTRRDVLTLGLTGAVALGLAGVGRLARAQVGPLAPAHPAAVGLSPFGELVLIPRTGSPVLVPGTRVVAEPSADTQVITASVEAEETWLAAGRAPEGEFAAMTRAALLDLRVLLRPGGALASAWTPGRRYVDPVHAAFGAAALAAHGHVDDALAIVGYLARVQTPDGRFAARNPFQPAGPSTGGGAGPEATGWVMWALAVVLAQGEARRRRRYASLALYPMHQRSVAAMLNGLDADGLPLPPADEHGHRGALTLRQAISDLLGLRAAVALETVFGGGMQGAFALAAVADRTDEAIGARFGPGYPSRPRPGARVSPDPWVGLLLPPFGPREDDDRRAAARRVLAGFDRPARGLPTAAVVASATDAAVATIGGGGSPDPADRAAARETLRWIGRHLTPAGSLPERLVVGEAALGSLAAGPAPTALGAASLLLAVAAVEAGGTSTLT